MLLSPGRCPGLRAFWAFSPLQPTRRSPRSCCILLFTLQKACYTRSVCLSPRSCCILLFTLQRACYTRSVCLSPAKRLFIVVNVVFVVFPSQQAISERERARWQGSFRSYGEVPLVGAVGGWPVGSPGASPSPCAQGGGRVSGFQRGREACRPAPWVNRPACRRPRYPGLRRRPWWPS